MVVLSLFNNFISWYCHIVLHYENYCAETELDVDVFYFVDFLCCYEDDLFTETQFSLTFEMQERKMTHYVHHVLQIYKT